MCRLFEHNFGTVRSTDEAWFVDSDRCLCFDSALSNRGSCLDRFGRARSAIFCSCHRFTSLIVDSRLFWSNFLVARVTNASAKARKHRPEMTGVDEMEEGG